MAIRSAQKEYWYQAFQPSGKMFAESQSLIELVRIASAWGERESLIGPLRFYRVTIETTITEKIKEIDPKSKKGSTRKWSFGNV